MTITKIGLRITNGETVDENYLAEEVLINKI